MGTTFAARQAYLTGKSVTYVNRGSVITVQPNGRITSAPAVSLVKGFRHTPAPLTYLARVELGRR